jgi:hypothetical protein
MKVRQRVLALLTATVLGTGGALALAAPAHANSYGPYFIVHAASGLCVEVPNSSNVAGEQLRLNSCRDTLGQFFTFVDAGGSSLFFIQPAYNSYCLQPGAPDLFNSTIIQWACDQTFNQTWFVMDHYKLENTHSVLCMGVGTGVVGAYVVQNNCHNGTIWSLQLA